MVIQVQVDPIAVVKDVQGGAAGNCNVVDPASQALRTKRGLTTIHNSRAAPPLSAAE
jgi:hypothetical protein